MLDVKLGTAFKEAHATVPAQNAVVIPNRADLFCIGETVQSFFDERQKDVGGGASAKLSLGPAFEEQAGVIGALVRVA
jgi:hypothetical protein